MAAAKALARTALRDLSVVAFLGGPEVDVLVGRGQARAVSFAYVGLDLLGLAPNFRRARERGELDVCEYSESMFITALQAAVRRVPFLPTRSGIGADVVAVPGAPFARVECPFTGEVLTAVPALAPDVAFLHANEADRLGNARICGDPFLDSLLARASGQVVVVADRVVERLSPGSSRDTIISRVWVSHVCEVPSPTDFTGAFPDVPVDYEAAAEYAARAADGAWLDAYVGAEVLIP
jgi:glutaconate CoA-transferase subunit A